MGFLRTLSVRLSMLETFALNVSRDTSTIRDQLSVNLSILCARSLMWLMAVVLTVSLGIL